MHHHQRLCACACVCTRLYFSVHHLIMTLISLEIVVYLALFSSASSYGIVIILWLSTTTTKSESKSLITFGMCSVHIRTLNSIFLLDLMMSQCVWSVFSLLLLLLGERTHTKNASINFVHLEFEFLQKGIFRFEITRYLQWYHRPDPFQFSGWNLYKAQNYLILRTGFVSNYALSLKVQHANTHTLVSSDFYIVSQSHYNLIELIL